MLGLVLLASCGAGCGADPRTAGRGSGAGETALDAPAARAALLEALASPRAGEHRAAVARIAAWSPPDIEWLLSLLVHPHRGVREGVAHALGDLAPDDPRVGPALLAAFEDPDDYVRWKAARALGRLPRLPPGAAAALRAAAEAAQETEVVRAAARTALERHAPAGR